MKIWTIIKKEYRQIVRKKSFVISTILTPVMMAGFIFLPMLLMKMGRDEKTIVIEDYSGIVKQHFQEKVKADKKVETELKLKFKTGSAVPEMSSRQNNLLKEYEKNLADKKQGQLEIIPEYEQKILDKEIDGLVLIPENVKKTRRIFFCALNISDFKTNEYITTTVQKILSEKILTEQNIDIKIVKEAIRDVNLGTFKVKKEGTSKASSGMEYMMSILMLSILFTVIMAYGQLISERYFTKRYRCVEKNLS